MTAMDSVGFVLGVWVGCTGLVLGAEKARQEWVARKAARLAPAPEVVDNVRFLIPAQRTGGEPR